MDAMDVLGALLGRKTSRGTPSGNVLKDMLGGGGRDSAPSRTQDSRSPSRGSQNHPSSRHNRPRSIGEAARSLEELLNVSQSRHSQQRSAPPESRRPDPPRRDSYSYEPPQDEQEELNEQTLVLVRAMIGAAKSDGHVTTDEQQAILKQLGHVTESTLRFLRDEFARPVDVRELAWSVPLGMEEQVYSISLLAMELDENKEAHYLADLAHGLRLKPNTCNDIHRRFGAPVIFKE